MFAAKENRKSHLQLSNLQCCHFDIVLLRLAIMIVMFKMTAFSIDRRHLHSSMAWFTTDWSKQWHIYYVISNIFFE